MLLSLPSLGKPRAKSPCPSPPFQQVFSPVRAPPPFLEPSLTGQGSPFILIVEGARARGLHTILKQTVQVLSSCPFFRCNLFTLSKGEGSPLLSSALPRPERPVLSGIEAGPRAATPCRRAWPQRGSAAFRPCGALPKKNRANDIPPGGRVHQPISPFRLPLRPGCPALTISLWHLAIG